MFGFPWYVTLRSTCSTPLFYSTHVVVNLPEEIYSQSGFIQRTKVNLFVTSQAFILQHKTAGQVRMWKRNTNYFLRTFHEPKNYLSTRLWDVYCKNQTLKVVDLLWNWIHRKMCIHILWKIFSYNRKPTKKILVLQACSHIY